MNHNTIKSKINNLAAENHITDGVKQKIIDLCKELGYVEPKSKKEVLRFPQEGEVWKAQGNCFLLMLSDKNYVCFDQTHIFMNGGKGTGITDSWITDKTITFFASNLEEAFQRRMKEQ